MKAIKLLLKRGAQTDLQDRTGFSALRWAVIHQHVDMVKLLLRYNASVTKDCYTLGSALDIARQGTSKPHAFILEELEKKLVVEREALLVGVVERKKQDAIAEIRAYREKLEAENEAEKDTTAAANAASTTDSAAQSAAKAMTRSRRQSSHKVVAGISRRPSLETSVGTRVPTPLVEQATWESLLGNSDESSEWVKVATGKWQVRKQDVGIPISIEETTMVEVFAPDKATVCKLLTSDGKWKSFLAQQMPHKVSQAQLTIED
ncbi:hypothetical protein V7S43_007437 [Phytophthora oleae]|uniref:Uncharacterized protein n=1 Tax=Phytophthora oleae TaxID=2107226 RepID=A0ABD3FJW3_9STRA